MIKMQVGEKYIGNIIRMKTIFRQWFIQCVIPVQVVMVEEPGILFISVPVINQYQPVAIFYQQATQGPWAKIVFIGRGDLFYANAAKERKDYETLLN